MARIFWPALLLVLRAGFTPGAAAQVSSDASVRRAGDVPYRVRRTGDAIRLDARFAESVWHDADSIVNCRQREPLEGAPATERTVVKIVRDADQLYVSVRAFDRDIAGVRSTQLRRDADLSSDDNVTILIDS